jgi:SHS2 domain-containing protein
MGKRYEFLPHTADIAMRAWGRDRIRLVQNAAAGMASFMASPRQVQPVEERKLFLKAATAAEGMIRLLNEMLFLFDTQLFLSRRIRIVSWEGSALCVRLEGEEYDPCRHALMAPIKAATYHGLEVRETPEGLEATIVFDV